MKVNNSRYCALLVACTLGMGNRAAGDARRSVQATSKHECSYDAGKY